MQATSLISVRVSAEIAERLQHLAESINRSKSYVAAEALEEYLDLHEWQIQAIQQGIADVDEGDITSFANVKQYWKKRFED